MKILHLNTYDHGGAGRAVSRIHQGLLSSGVNSQILAKTMQREVAGVLSKKPFEPFSGLITKALKSGEFLPTKLYPNRNNTSFSSQWLPDMVASQVANLSPDIIHLHWINHGFVKIETLAKLQQPIVWTLHDMWAFTGGCHYSLACDSYQTKCGQCPLLQSQHHYDLSSWIWSRKRKSWKNLDLTIVSPSRWLAECAQASALFKDSRIEVIPHGLDLTLYHPVDKKEAKEALNLPCDKKIILFGAVNASGDNRKGFDLLLSALEKLGETNWREKIHLVIFGISKTEKTVNLGCETQYIGRIRDDKKLVQAYSAADVMIVPSTQEAFGQTASESMACGTPVVAFNATGLKDIVRHQETGYLAKPFVADDLAQGIIWTLEDNERHLRLCETSRDVMEKEFSLDTQSKRYTSLYKDISRMYSGSLT